MFKKIDWKFSIILVLVLSGMAVGAYTTFSSLRLEATIDESYLIRGFNSSGTEQIRVDTSGAGYLAAGNLVWNSSGQITSAGGTTRTYTQEVKFGINDWMRVWTGTEVSFDGRLDTNPFNNYPYLKTGVVSAAIVWPQYHPLDRAVSLNNSYLGDSGISPVQVVFQVPADYRSGAVFKFVAEQDATARGTYTTTAAVRIGYQMFITTPTSYWDDSAITHDPVQVGTVGYLLSPTTVTLAVSSSEAAFEAGKWITFQYWRVRDESVVDDLRVLRAAFQYEKQY